MSEVKKEVLFVDDDADFLALVNEVVGPLSAESWHLTLLDSAAAALERLQQHPVDLLVLDVQMPVIDGLQLLHLLQRRYPNLLKVALTADAHETRRAACLNAGAELCLQKPQTPEAWPQLYRALNQLLIAPPPEAFRGVLRQVRLEDLVQTECLARKSSLLEVAAGNTRGRIFIRQGEIIHAQHQTLEGAAAFHELFRLAGAEFQIRPFSDPPARTIQEPWKSLLREAVRGRDESQSAAAAQPDRPSAALEEVLAECLSARPEGSAAEAALTPAAPLRPRVQEMLICTLDGEVLHDWQCPDLHGRIGLLEFISQRARRIGARLPLGPWDRVESSDESRRSITLVREDHALFVRLAYAPEARAIS